MTDGRTLTIKLPHWLKGPPPAQPPRGISNDLIYAMGTPPSIPMDEAHAERYYRIMNAAIRGARDQENWALSEWHRKMRAYREPIEVGALGVCGMGRARCVPGVPHRPHG